ncbi:hypothetical protein QJS04_geneDACA007208 [Acorus gramineus]|uniref:Uncharacterized protein n=1 Tax=Acorus gramineus TaxID=55184 RepID=A0AAV9BQ56_ACOGR|nr:hypothetical protein QJS04_geneDACA007208 [Acorus gramineus]
MTHTNREMFQIFICVAPTKSPLFYFLGNLFLFNKIKDICLLFPKKKKNIYMLPSLEGLF